MLEGISGLSSIECISVGIHLVSLMKQYVLLQVQDFTDQFPGSSAALKTKSSRWQVCY